MCILWISYFNKIRPSQIDLWFLVNLRSKNLPASREKTNEPQKKNDMICEMLYQNKIQDFSISLTLKTFVLMLCSKITLRKKYKIVSEHQLIFLAKTHFSKMCHYLPFLACVLVFFGGEGWKLPVNLPASLRKTTNQFGMTLSRLYIIVYRL